MSISRFASRKREMETHAEVTVHAEAAVPAWGDNIFKAFCALFVCPLQPLFSLFLSVPFLFLFLHHLLLFFTKNRPSTLCTLWYNTHSDNNVNNVINKRNMINKMSLEPTVYFGYQYGLLHVTSASLNKVQPRPTDREHSDWMWNERSEGFLPCLLFFLVTSL